MAVTITKTIGELFAYSGWRACKAIYDALDTSVPGWTEDTSVNVLTYSEGMRTIGQSANVNYSVYRYLSAPQRLNFLNWAFDQLILVTPANYPNKAAMATFKAAIVDCATAPTAQKQNNLRATAKAIKPDTSSNADLFVANAFKGVANAVANNAVTAEVVGDVAHNLVRASMRLAGLTSLQANDAILTQLQIVVGIRDP